MNLVLLFLLRKGYRILHFMKSQFIPCMPGEGFTKRSFRSEITMTSRTSKVQRTRNVYPINAFELATMGRRIDISLIYGSCECAFPSLRTTQMFFNKFRRQSNFHNFSRGIVLLLKRNE